MSAFHAEAGQGVEIGLGKVGARRLETDELGTGAVAQLQDPALDRGIPLGAVGLGQGRDLGEKLVRTRLGDGGGGLAIAAKEGDGANGSRGLWGPGLKRGGARTPRPAPESRARFAANATVCRPTS